VTGLIVPSLVILYLEVFVGHISPSIAVERILGRQFSEGNNLFLLAVFGLIPFVALSVICSVAATRLTPVRLACLGIGGLVGILVLMIPGHMSVWYPLYGVGRKSSTAVIAFLFIPFFCLGTLAIGLIFGWLISLLPVFCHARQPDASMGDDTYRERNEQRIRRWLVPSVIVLVGVVMLPLTAYVFRQGKSGTTGSSKVFENPRQDGDVVDKGKSRTTKNSNVFENSPKHGDLSNQGQVRKSAKGDTESCPLEETARSIRGDTATQIYFANNSGETIKVFWLDYKGKRKHYKTLRPGEHYTQGTYLTHPWVVTNSAEVCLGVYFPATEMRTMEILNEP